MNYLIVCPECREDGWPIREPFKDCPHAPPPHEAPELIPKPRLPTPAAVPTEDVDPEQWLQNRGWTRYENSGGVYWRRTPNEPGWEGGWNTGGAVNQQLEADNRALLESMGLYRPPTPKRKRR